jgi:outer membrane lipoprotein-sorting protein
MGFLGQVKDGDEAQWIYLPSSGQVRRVVTGKTKAGLLGSEISPEDLNSNAIRGARAKLIPSKSSSWVVEVVPPKGTSSYSKAVSHIDKKNYLPSKIEYYVGKKIKKTVEFKDYKKFGNVFRAQKIEVKNHFNGRRTEVRLSQIKVNSGLKEDDFTQAALKD